MLSDTHTRRVFEILIFPPLWFTLPLNIFPRLTRFIRQHAAGRATKLNSSSLIKSEVDSDDGF
jgi:hypothetical protein